MPSRPKPSAMLAFQNPAAHTPTSSAIERVRSCRLAKETASAPSGDTTGSEMRTLAGLWLVASQRYLLVLLSGVALIGIMT